ncbi:MAG: electron transfer flavoprotein subunit alpha/FixB family protein, partial [Candidatus Bathyarchaeia archaeon]
GEIRAVTREAIKKALDVKTQIGGKASVAILGQNVKDAADQLSNLGVDEVLTVNDEKLANYTPDGYAKVLGNVITERKPTLTILGHTAYSMDLAPKIAVKLNLPLVTDCLDAGVQNGKLSVTREMYNGKVEAKFEAYNAQQYIVTLRPGVHEAAAEDKTRKAQIVEVPSQLTPEDIRWKVLERIKPAAEDVDITKADVIVSIGRGIKDQQNIPMAQELADAVNGVLACSRPIIDKGWLSKGRQVGSSGKVVKPKLYIALGISGATQHITGMKGSSLVIAVNKDPKAPVFKFANYGVVDDLFKVVPLLTQQLKA